MEFLGELAKQGLLALLLAISLSMNFMLGRLLLYEKDKRIEDAIKNRDDIVTPINNLTHSIEIQTRKIEISKGARSEDY